MNSKIIEGYLHKWTNYIKGYQKRYFVLQDGLLSYYRNTEEISKICRDTINILNAKIHISDNHCFVISQSNMQTLHLKAYNESDLIKWTKALTEAQKRAKDFMRNGYSINDSDIEPVDAINSSLIALKLQLDEMKSTNDVLNKKFDDLLKSIQDVEKDKIINTNPDSCLKMKTIKERATICRVTLAKSSVNYTSYTALLTKESERWLKALNHERIQKQRLENMVEELGKQLRNLELNIQNKNRQGTVVDTVKESDGSDDDFYDATEHQQEVFNIFNVTLPSPQNNTSTGNPINMQDHRASDLSFEYESDVESDTSHSDTAAGDLDATSASSKQQTRNKHKHDKSLPGQENDSLDITNDQERAVKARTLTRNRRAKVVSGKYRGKLLADNNIQSISPQNALYDSNTQNSKGGSTYSLINFDTIKAREKKTRRTSIPFKPNISLNLWSIVKNNIGKDLSKIPMPVNLCEPLSMLQRLAEDFEYSSILDKAAQISNPIDQMPYIAAFTVSSYGATAQRVNKPFNPMLGETYEFDRTDDLGWRLVAEQLSHHPPECAVHCESNEWKCWFNFSMTSKFRGKYLQINPIGKSHLIFKNNKSHFVWDKVPMTIHNIIVGKVWIDNHGEIDIINHTNGDKCHLTYKQYSMFSSDVQKLVTGAITDKSDQAYYVLSGTWDEKLEAKRVISNSKTSKGKTVLETSDVLIPLWKRPHPMKDAEKMYFFTNFTLTLNEMDENIAPTDSRNRPDQRLMEEGRWDEANLEKTRLEENQRGRKREIIHENGTKEFIYEYTPLWFNKIKDPDTKTDTQFFNGKYWEAKEAKNWSMCNQIF